MIQLVIFILNTAGKFIASLLAIEGVLFLSSFSVLWFFFILGSGAQVHRQELQKAHPELFKNEIQDNSSPHSGKHIAVILFGFYYRLDRSVLQE